MYGLTSQMNRSSVAIPSNIAEGYGRKSKNEFRQFISIAYGSALELETQLILAQKFNYVNTKNFDQASSLLQEVLKMLNSLTSKLKATD